MDNLRRFYDIMLRAGLAPLPWDQWRAQAGENTELWPIMKHGLMVGGILFKGHTVHIAILPEWHKRWITKTLRRAYDTWTHAVPIVGSIHRDNRAAAELATRLGFTLKADQGLYHLYEKGPTP